MSDRDGRVSIGSMPPRRLQEILEELGSVLVAYSGGVDSAYLAYAAHSVLGPRALAAIADSPSLPRAELDGALRTAKAAGFPVAVVRTDEFGRQEYLRNDADRCFHCKEALFDRIFPLAAQRGLDHVALGTVTDDIGDIRPGLVSAKRRGARAPLLEADLSKDEVRALARAAGLPVWDKPQAACLSSRVPHGTPVTKQALASIERAEEAVRSLGFSVVRVRHHGDTARLEIGADELGRLADQALRARAVEAVRSAGYERVVVDPQGYRRGGSRLPLLEAR